MSETEVIEGATTEVPGPYYAPGTSVMAYEPAPAPVTLFRTDDPAEVLRRATATADILADAVKSRGLMVKIGGKDFPTVEAWTMLGTMLGVFPITVWTRPLDNGWEARVEARTLAGQLVGAAEAQCTRSESSWRNRDDYALRSMAATRATGKALRLPLGFVMSLAGYEATPAEEMIDEKTAHRVNTTTGEIVEPKPKPAAKKKSAEPAPLIPEEMIADTVAAVAADRKEPSQPQIERYVAPDGERDPDDIPFESSVPPSAEEMLEAKAADDEKIHDAGAISRAILIRRTLGVAVSHGVDLTEERLFDFVEKLSTDGRSVFYGFKGDDFEDMTEAQGKKVMDWIEQAAKKKRDSE